MTVVTGFPPNTLYHITNVTQACPGVVTVTSVDEDDAFPLTNGTVVTISKINGMYQLNNNRYVVAGLDTDAKTFQLYNLRFQKVDTTNFCPYIEGGEANIISYPPPAGQPPGLMYNNQPS